MCKFWAGWLGILEAMPAREARRAKIWSLLAWRKGKILRETLVKSYAGARSAPAKIWVFWLRAKAKPLVNP